MREITITQEYITNSFDWNSLGSLADTKIFFDSSLMPEDIIKSFNSILDLEEKEFSQSVSTLSIMLKGLSTEYLIDIYKKLLFRKTLVNPQILSNISILLPSYNTLDDSFFNSDFIYESSLDQLIDIKLGLSNELKTFQHELCLWYLGCIKYASKIEYTYLDDVKEIPAIYKSLIAMSSFMQMSTILQKTTNIDFQMVPFPKDAYFVIYELANKAKISNALFSKIFESIIQ